MNRGLETGEGVPQAGRGRDPGRVVEPSLAPWIWRAACAIWKYVLGAILCFNPVGAVAVLGWSQRVAQRFVLLHWWYHSPARCRGLTWRTFLGGGAATRAHLEWPNWVLAGRVGRPGWRHPVGRLLGSLGTNLRVGAQSLFNVWVFTLPGCLLWAAGWFTGWQISFNKAYEHAFVGRMVFGVGILLFLAAMIHVPWGQARQEATGSWRSFYDFRLLWVLLQRRWFASVVLAGLFVAFSFPLNVLKTVPAGVGNMDWVARLDPGQQLRVIETYFLACGLVVFPAFLILRVVAAWFYAGAVREALQRGVIGEDALADFEWEALHRLELLSEPKGGPAPWWLRGIRRMGRFAGGVIAVAAPLLVWFGLVVQITTTEFLNHHIGGRGWWNQPLIHVPWFDYAPAALGHATR